MQIIGGILKTSPPFSRHFNPLGISFPYPLSAIVFGIGDIGDCVHSTGGHGIEALTIAVVGATALIATAFAITLAVVIIEMWSPQATRRRERKR